MTLEELRRKVLPFESERIHLRRSLVEKRRELVASEKRVEDSLRAREIVQRVARTVQEQAYQCVSEVVSRCLALVFDEPYEFQMEFVEKRGRTEVELFFSRKGQRIDPMLASGGGVVDVAAFALRLAAIVLAGRKISRVLILDEPFKFVSEGYRARIGELLEELSEKLRVQIVMVTHIEELKIGQVVEIS